MHPAYTDFCLIAERAVVTKYFPLLLFLTATRETAFMYAITAAAITHEFTHQCTLGRIPGCGCGTYYGDGVISGCGENIAFGQREAMRLFRVPRKRRLRLDALTAVNMHNYNLGTKVSYHA